MRLPNCLFTLPSSLFISPSFLINPFLNYCQDPAHFLNFFAPVSILELFIISHGPKARKEKARR